jgi:N utilization substance protein B
MANRHLSRSVVLQSLFEWDFAGRDENAITELVTRNADEFAASTGDLAFMSDLAANTLKKRSEIDSIIEKAAPEWPLDKISIIDRNVLRIGLYELLFADRKEVPAKVAINEAIELAKSFGGENSGRFVNGVLGAVYKELGEPGKDSPPRGAKKQVDLKNLPLDLLAGAVVFSKAGDEIYLALVHDIFGHWTLSKGHVKPEEEEQEGLKRIVAEEMGLKSITIKEQLGQNEYVATDPEKGKLKKRVVYYLAESPYVETVLGKKGGLDDAQWFKLSDILDLNFYHDILPIVTKAVNILLGQHK